MSASELPLEMPKPDRPWGWTIATLFVLMVCSALFITLPFFAAGVETRACGGGYQGPVYDDQGHLTIPGRTLPETCTGGSGQLSELGRLVAVEAIPVIGILLSFGSLRTLGQRWNNRLFGPLAWSLGSGFFLAWFLLAFPPTTWWFWSESLCDSTGCITTSHFRPVAAIISSAVTIVVAIPFLLSLRRLVAVWLSAHATQ